MGYRESLRDRIQELRDELDELEDTLEIDGAPVSGDDTGRIETAIRELGLKVDALTVIVARLDERRQTTERDAASALSAASALGDVVRCAQAQAESATREAQAARASIEAQAIKQADLETRIRASEQSDRDRIVRSRTLATAVGLGGSAGVGSMIWQVVAAWPW